MNKDVILDFKQQDTQTCHKRFFHGMWMREDSNGSSYPSIIGLHLIKEGEDGWHENQRTYTTKYYRKDVENFRCFKIYSKSGKISESDDKFVLNDNNSANEFISSIVVDIDNKNDKRSLVEIYKYAEYLGLMPNKIIGNDEKCSYHLVFDLEPKLCLRKNGKDFINNRSVARYLRLGLAQLFKGDLAFTNGFCKNPFYPAFKSSVWNEKPYTVRELKNKLVSLGIDINFTKEKLSNKYLVKKICREGRHQTMFFALTEFNKQLNWKANYKELYDQANIYQNDFHEKGLGMLPANEVSRIVSAVARYGLRAHKAAKKLNFMPLAHPTRTIPNFGALVGARNNMISANRYIFMLVDFIKKNDLSWFVNPNKKRPKGEARKYSEINLFIRNSLQRYTKKNGMVETVAARGRSIYAKIIGEIRLYLKENNQKVENLDINKLPSVIERQSKITKLTVKINSIGVPFGRFTKKDKDGSVKNWVGYSKAVHKVYQWAKHFTERDDLILYIYIQCGKDKDNFFAHVSYLDYMIHQEGDFVETLSTNNYDSDVYEHLRDTYNYLVSHYDRVDKLNKRLIHAEYNIEDLEDFLEINTYYDFEDYQAVI